MIRLFRQAAWWLIAPLLSLAVFWRVPFVWFRIDDFAWLSLPQRVPIDGLWQTLSSPAAQGTVRVLSERLYFLMLTSLFGITSWPFRGAALLTWVAVLWLVQAIGARLTGSQTAGLFAGLLWAANANMTTPLAWASSYNQVLIALLMLTAFYSRLRWIESGANKWRIAEGAAFLLGFGVLEIVVMYPVWVLLHAMLLRTDATDRASRSTLKGGTWESGLWMFVPAGLFALAHLFLIPKTDSPIYARTINAQLPATLWHYLEWTIAPWRSTTHSQLPALIGLVTLIAIAATLALFGASRLRERDPLPALFTGWFLIWIAPVLPLAQHFSGYYLTVPGIGIAWLAGYAMARALASRSLLRVAGLSLAAGYVVGSAKHADTETAWLLDLTSRIRIAARAVENTTAAHPGATVLLHGFDEEAFIHSFPMGLDSLLGAKVWLPPGDDLVVDRTDSGDLSRFRTTPDAILAALDHQQLRVISLDGSLVSGGLAHDVTAPYHLARQAVATQGAPSFVDVGLARSAPQLGQGWHDIENAARWSGKRAQVRLSIPEDSKTLLITGFAPQQAVTQGPVVFAVTAIDAAGAEHAIGAYEATQPGTFDAALPLNGVHGSVTVEFELNRTFTPPGDGRELGLVFGTFSAR